jgi:hypothetical protein
LAKVATMIEVARRTSLISDSNAARARTLMVELEQLLKASIAPPKPAGSAHTAPPEANAAHPMEERPFVTSTAEGLPADVIEELRQLADRDSRPLDDGAESGQKDASSQCEENAWDPKDASGEPVLWDEESESSLGVVDLRESSHVSAGDPRQRGRNGGHSPRGK